MINDNLNINPNNVPINNNNNNSNENIVISVNNVPIKLIDRKDKIDNNEINLESDFFI